MNGSRYRCYAGFAQMTVFFAHPSCRLASRDEDLQARMMESCSTEQEVSKRPRKTKNHCPSGYPASFSASHEERTSTSHHTRNEYREER